MGEIADDMVDDLFETLGDETEDEDGTELNYYGPRKAYTSKTCSHCNVSGFHWRKHNGKWRLFDSSEKIHTCKSFVMVPKPVAKKPEFMPVPAGYKMSTVRATQQTNSIKKQSTTNSSWDEIMCGNKDEPRGEN